MSVRLSIISKEERERIHGKCLDVLSNVGVQFNSRKALALLADAGCEVDMEELSAKIPSQLVEKAMQTVPDRMNLAARNPDKDLQFGAGQLNFISAAQNSFFRDLETGERRASTTEDLIKCAILCDALDEVTEFCPMVVPNDVPPILRGLQATKIACTYTSMHILDVTPRLLTQPFFLAMMDALLGDRAKLKDSPRFTQVVNDVSPLQKDGDMVDTTLALRDYTPPILLYHMPMAGATSPATLAGTVVEMTANMLSSVVLYQLAQPGWPMIWGTGPGVMDMRTGRFSGRTELALMSVAHVEMAKFYGIPSLSGDVSSLDGMAIGFQSGMDAVLGSLPVVLAGTDGLWGPGDLDAANLADLPFLMLCTEIVRHLWRFKQGITVDEEHLLGDVITKMRFQGDYLSDPSTKKHFRQEHLLPKLFPRESFEAWQARGQTEREVAVEHVKRILNTHKPDPLPDDVAKEIDGVLEAARKTLVK